MGHAPNHIRVISGADIEWLVDRGTVLDLLGRGFEALSSGGVQAPPRNKVDAAGKGISLAMLAWAPGHHITQKTVNVYHGNPALGLESHQALVSLFDWETGAPIAILDGASLTGIRTAAAAVLSVKVLARADARTALVVGAGVQGREHVRQLALAREFAEVRVYARDRAKAEALAALVPNGRVVTDLEAATRTADVVCLTTSAERGVIEADWVRPGTHVTSVGFAPPGSELPLDLIGRSRVVVEAMAAFEPAPVGCAELAGRDKGDAAELGQILLGHRPGRTSADQITLYKSMGHAMEDMIVANLAYEAALAAGAGSSIVL
jgi:ornithine cyclodeaminase/thiomorpholine-carboxylate dehydrogenase